MWVCVWCGMVVSVNMCVVWYVYSVTDIVVVVRVGMCVV